MKDYLEIIEKLNKDLNKFIKEFVLIDEKNPSNEIIKESFKAYTDKYYKFSLDINNDLNKKILNLETSFNQNLKILNSKQTELNKKLKSDTLAIKEKYEEIFKSLNIQIKELEKKTNNEIDSTLFSIDTYIESSNQNIEMFELELNRSLSRYDYQISIAKQSYDDNIKQYNDRLANKLSLIVNQYKNDIKKCDKEFEELIKSYNDEIAKNQKVIDEIEKNYHVLLFDVKEKQRTESIKNNDDIRKIMDYKNEEIGKYKDKYLESRNNDTVEKSEKDDIRKQQDMQTSKEFAYNIHLIDEELSLLKNNYDEEKNNINQELNYSIYNLHKEQEKEILASSSDIKKINKDYYKKMNNEENRFKNLLDSIEKDYNNNYSEKIYNKKILDIKRLNELDKKKEERTRDNKYYQEKNLRYELIRDYNSSIISKKHTNETNKLRYQFSLMDLEFENEIQKINADYQIKMKKQNNIIDRYSLEIETAKKLNDLNHQYLDSIYDNDNKYLTINNLLEIEKCKTLYEYNKNKYYLNVRNSKDIYEYSKSRIELSNKQFDLLNKKDIEIIKKKAEINILSIRQKGELLSIEEQKSYDEINNNNNYESQKLKFNTEIAKNKNDITIFYEMINSYTLLILNAIELLNNLVESIIYNLDINIVKENHIHTLISNLKTMIVEYIGEVSDDYIVSINNQIDKHIEFEDSFNFNNIIEKVNNDSDYNSRVLLMKKNELNNRIEFLNNDTEEIRREIYNIQFVISKAEYKKINGKNKIIQDMAKIKQNTKEIDELTNQIDNINEKINKNNKKYISDIDSINKLKADKVNHYNKFKHNLNQAIIDLLDVLDKNNSPENLNIYQTIKAGLPKINDKDIYSCFESLNEFIEDCDYIINNDIKRIDDENNQRILSIKNNYSELLENKKINDEKQNSIKNKELQFLTKEKINTQKMCDDSMRHNEIAHNKVVKKLVVANKNVTVRFYHDLYALMNNIDDINDEYEILVSNRDKNYIKEKKSIIDNAILQINDNEHKYDQYVAQRKQLVKNIPVLTKEKKTQLNIKLKKDNQDIKEALVEEKIKYNQELKDIEKRLLRIDVNYNLALQKVQVRNNKKMIEEKRNFKNSLK